MKNNHHTVLKTVFKTVQNTVREEGMITAGDRILAAVSGGPDSVALAYILHELSGLFSADLGIAHVNHQLRGAASDRDAAFAKSLAAGLDLPFFSHTADVKEYCRQHKLSLEEGGRRIRYAFFEQTAKAGHYQRIALGHHANDNAELVLMYLLRGSGKTGLSGIPPQRQAQDSSIIRPLIHVTRQQIASYLEARGLEFMEDASNHDPRFLRNRIRHDLIPRLAKEYNPEIVDALNRMAGIFRDEDQWMQKQTALILNQCMVSKTAHAVTLKMLCLKEQDRALKCRIIREVICRIKGDLRRITRDHIDAVLMMMSRSKGKKQIHLPDRLIITAEYGMIRIEQTENNPRYLPRKPGEVFEYDIREPGIVLIPEIGRAIRVSEIMIQNHAGLTALVWETINTTVYMDRAYVKFPITIRNIRPGDRFIPLGLSGTQKIKKYFIDHKIPVSCRKTTPVLTCSDKIIWLAGHRMDASVRIDFETGRFPRRALKVELLLA